MSHAQSAVRDEAIATLKEWITPGDTVYTVLRHVSRSGMQREIGIVLLNAESHSSFPADSTVRDLHPNYIVAKALGLKLTKNGDGVQVGGCGMDMGFSLVYELSARLWPEGFTCTGKGCHSNAHSNGDRDYTPHAHRDGGYALQQRWL